ncbi:hypothetical protein [Salinibacillus xinjiangensis]|uniref:Uncharacterized protein n=1 Tax=Salinibacillus xinjiangensis TaxID=1229268 RepID=A0A6G1X3N5_9BACI|nr:hypothetical protein [Salinibacillus xinjiangensis]MRG85516.1 hypothetical protein [Salinibacillus xinjiangensis]
MGKRKPSPFQNEFYFVLILHFDHSLAILFIFTGKIFDGFLSLEVVANSIFMVG